MNPYQFYELPLLCQETCPLPSSLPRYYQDVRNQWFVFHHMMLSENYIRLSEAP